MINAAFAKGASKHEKQAAAREVLARFKPAAPIAPFPPLAQVIANVPRNGELSKEASMGYAASLGFYNSNLRNLGWDKPTLVAVMNQLWLTLGCNEVPIIPKDTLGQWLATSSRYEGRWCAPVLCFSCDFHTMF